MSEMKRCSACGELFSRTSEYFQLRKDSKDGFRNTCRRCSSNWRREHYELNKENAKLYRQLNKEHVRSSRRKYYEDNKEKESSRKKKYYYENKEIIAKNHKIYRERNKEYFTRYKINYYLSNKEFIKIKWKKYRIEHKVSIASKLRKYKQEHRDECLIYNHNYRSKIKGLTHTLTTKQWESIKLQFGGKCAYCGGGGPLTREHFIALDNGGEFTKDNIIPACGSCNSSKRDSDFSVWYHKQTFYSKTRETNILKHLGYKNKKQQLTIF